MKKYLVPLLIVTLFFPTFALAKKIQSGRAPAHKIVGPSPSNNFNFYLNTTARSNIISGGSTVQFTTKDILYDRITAGTIDHEADVSSSVLPSGSSGTYSSDNTGVATVDASGRITRVADGTARINFKVTPQLGKYLTKQITYPVVRTSGEVVVRFNSYVAGSLGLHLYTDIDTRLGVLAASDSTTKLFSTEDHTTPTYVWNTSFWGYGVDLTSISPWNSYDPGHRAGVLISPRHVAMANHYPIANGYTIRFVKQDGTVVNRTITNQAQVGSTDIQIGVLDSDVPAGVSFAKVLPSTYANYLPSITSTTTVPTLNILGGSFLLSDTDKQGYVRELYELDSSVGFLRSTVTQRSNFFVRDYYVGDSGNASFLIINGALVLLDTTTSFGGYGPNYAANIAAINSVMSTLGGGYSLTTVDLSAFNTY